MIELTKGQELPLTFDDGRPRVRVRLGLGWDKSYTAGAMGNGRPDIDLDATAVQFMGDQLFDLAFYNNLATRDSSILHQGDNVSGKGDGDDEVIHLDLSKVYAKVDTLVFLVSSYQGHSLEWVDRAYVRLTDEEDSELARFRLTAGVPETGLVMAKIVRDSEHWTLRAIGEGIQVTKPTDSVQALLRFL